MAAHANPAHGASAFCATKYSASVQPYKKQVKMSLREWFQPIICSVNTKTVHFT